MKKLKPLLIALVGTSIIPFTSCGEQNNKIVLAEVTHSLFYAPLYVAYEKGYFEEEGLDLEIITTPGADKVMASLLSKDADIGLMGPEASVYVYKNGEENYAVNFAQLTQKDGSFLLGREKVDNFSYDMLKGKTIIGGRKGGMPEMTLEHVIKSKGLTITQNGVDKTADVNIRTDVSFDVMTGVFTAGQSDFVTAFQPNASKIEKLGKGYILTSIGEDSGEIPYTAFSTLKSNIKENKNKLKKFTKAIKKGLDFVNSSSTKDIIPYLHESFSSSDDEELTNVVNSYKNIEAWPSDIGFKKKNFDKLVSILKEAKELDTNYNVPYEKLVTSEII